MSAIAHLRVAKETLAADLIRRKRASYFIDRALEELVDRTQDVQAGQQGNEKSHATGADNRAVIRTGLSYAALAETFIVEKGEPAAFAEIANFIRAMRNDASITDGCIRSSLAKAKRFRSLRIGNVPYRWLSFSGPEAKETADTAPRSGLSDRSAGELERLPD